MKFFAHSTDNVDQSDWQPLSSHLTAVGKLAAEKAERFGAADYARIAGLLHDLGKYTEAFQKRLTGDFPKVDHSTWGACVACQRYGKLGKLLAYGIAGHHAGLADGRESGKRGSLAERLKAKGLPELLPDWQQEIELPSADSLPSPKGFRPHQKRPNFQLAFLTRMIFSCLVDADFLDTEAFYRKLDGKRNLRDVKVPDLTELREALNRHLSQFKLDTAVNEIRAEILRHVQANAILEPGLFSLTVPTGGGKTLTSLAFALDHAIRHGMRKVIYVIPFTSIVEQNAAVFREALGELGEQAVLEHHSAFIDDDTKKPESREKLTLAMENWDAPIVVTTAVQFFESLFADRPAKCRKLHNIAGSVVILDEAQVLPLKLLRPCVTALDELARNYHTSIVLCTATQPALKSSKFKDGFEEVHELAPEPERIFRRLKRVQVRHVGLKNDAELAEAMAGREQVLCIVNNRRHARALYESISDLAGTYHLTTLMCAKHRSQVLSEIKWQLVQGKPCRLVATSLIEAGVDVDFPTVLRAETGLDSIAQAAGRCNREGKRPVETSEVLIFSTGEKWKPPLELKQFAQAGREIFRNHADCPLSLQAVENYFQMLYWQKGEQALDGHDLLGRIEEGGIDGMPFETVASKFRMIENTQMPVIIPFDEIARTALRDLDYAERAGAIARRLQPYIVQLPRQGYDALRSAGAIQPVAEAKFGEQFIQLVNEPLYEDQVGLTWDDPVFIRAEKLVF
ncbi:MAG: CRISPR-associated endonuclease Cas3'' [Methylohalobius sp. ZOD2]